MPSFNLTHVVNIIARGLIPIFGVVFLGWSGTKLLVVYFADTVASMYCLMMLVFYASVLKEPEYQAWVKDGLTWTRRMRTGVGVALMPLPFLLLVAFFFGVLPLFVMLDLQGIGWGEFLRDRDLWIGVGCQFAGAATLLMNQLDWVRTLDDPQRFFKFQVGLLAARWGAMILVGFFLAPGIPKLIYGPLLIATYAIATVALELAPGRVMHALQNLLNRANSRGGADAAATPSPTSATARRASAAAKAPLPHHSAATTVVPHPPVPPQVQGATSAVSWLILCFGAAFMLIGAIWTWGALVFSLHATPATATVIEHHGGTGSRSASVIAQVEVAAPGARPFRAEVEDTFGTQTWDDGGSVQLVCTGSHSCAVDSLLDLWLWPLLFLGGGLAVVYWQVRKWMV